MKQANFLWVQPETSELSPAFKELLQTHTIPEHIGRLLWQRNIRSADALAAFLRPDLDHLYDPFLLFDMEKAVARIHEAIINEERILIYGDYDADGITSTTVLKETLELLGAEVSTYLPNRFTDGYGPNLAVYKKMISEGIQLIVTVDNGVSGHEAIAYAQQQGVDVIVTDHHELPEALPDAYAIIHPRHPSGDYPFGDLAGVGVAFKTACALLEEVPLELLDLVAIGTIADMVSLTDENRILVSNGLKMIQQSDRIGLNELLSISGVNKQQITETDIGFSVGPRLNAIGRLEDPNPAVTLMTTFDQEEAAALARELDTINQQRKSFVEAIMKEAQQKINPENEVHLVVGDNWHEGVLGIVAGRLMQQTGRPVIVLTKKEQGVAKGSGRSVAALNLFEMLSTMRDLFVNFGGHHAAVGLTIPTDDLALLQESMNKYVASEGIDLSEGIPLQIDDTLSLGDVTIELIDSLKVLAPFGLGNPLPKFLIKDLHTKSARQIGAEKQHLKLVMEDNTSTQLDVIGFGFGAEAHEFDNDDLSLVGQLTINEWNGNKKPQLMMDDFAVAGFQLFDYRSKRMRQGISFGNQTLGISFWAKLTTEAQRVCPNLTVYQTMPELIDVFNQGDFQEIAFLDCPKEPQVMKEIVEALAVNRINIVLLSPEDAYLDGVGSRDQYSRLFKLIQQQEQLDVRYKLKSIADFLKLPEKLLIFMIQVFSELEFVTIKDGVLKKNAAPANHPLTDSTVYQQRQQMIKTEEFLLMSDLSTLKQWLIS
ncbi:single-stranded-DNA-specific exonuclease RecJ [Enterococcus sp. 8G7_MSG3316]|uniref:Single-stranded-DNA-specific exonuclease RecJ n=1 Tax=Candidatus Enterococcus testudinis TaxID=1834191 RepID=A0A242A6I8_9ENTE|nr:single-stranded-DNA-specific exonuclease RecJ [Enterococcus sp. 8G7_MSG3316]OTN76529.1 single-stranded-DNA-specific exonuclease RecJ [Enterococcus sp. 8G7_MSG3316]